MVWRAIKIQLLDTSNRLFAIEITIICRCLVWVKFIRTMNLKWTSGNRRHTHTNNNTIPIVFGVPIQSNRFQPYSWANSSQSSLKMHKHQLQNAKILLQCLQSHWVWILHLLLTRTIHTRTPYFNIRPFKPICFTFGMTFGIVVRLSIPLGENGLVYDFERFSFFRCFGVSDWFTWMRWIAHPWFLEYATRNSNAYLCAAYTKRWHIWFWSVNNIAICSMFSFFVS